MTNTCQLWPKQKYANMAKVDFIANCKKKANSKVSIRSIIWPAYYLRELLKDVINHLSFNQGKRRLHSVLFGMNRVSLVVENPIYREPSEYLFLRKSDKYFKKFKVSNM